MVQESHNDIFVNYNPALLQCKVTFFPNDSSYQKSPKKKNEKKEKEQNTPKKQATRKNTEVDDSRKK